MRLTEEERHVIRSAVLRHFGSDAKILLFGSRIHDDRRGGDIDLLITSSLEVRESLHAKMMTLSEIQFALGEQKIDMIVARAGATRDDKRAVVEQAISQGIEL